MLRLPVVCLAATLLIGLHKFVEAGVLAGGLAGYKGHAPQAAGQQEVVTVQREFVTSPGLVPTKKFSELPGNGSLEVDFLTMPLKFRPNSGILPAQLNASLNGALYIGYRVQLGPPGLIVNNMSPGFLNLPVGISAGFFAGLGNAAITPTTTANDLQKEYEGIVWNKGMAALLTFQNIRAGLAVGLGLLLDRNSRLWVYNNKPWVGLAISLELE